MRGPRATGRPGREGGGRGVHRAPAGPVEVRVLREAGTEDLPLPAYMTEGASGLDLVAALTEPVCLEPGSRALIPTGLRLEIPRGYEGQVRPRSGLAARTGVTVLNSPGTVDSDYRGEVKVILVNLGDSTATVRRGDRIAQLVICPVTRVSLVPARRLDTSARGEGGFGHTGGLPGGGPGDSSPGAAGPGPDDRT